LASSWNGDKWDYKKLVVANDDMIGRLGVVGGEGWELVTAVFSGVRWTLILKRPRNG
jgi:hypothetical protein